MSEIKPKSSERMSSQSVRPERSDQNVLGAQLLHRARDQGVAENLAELQVEGYTVLNGVMPEEFRQALREAILSQSEIAERSGEKTFGFGPNTRVLYDVVAAIPEVPAALLNPLLATLITSLLGDGYVANLVTGSVFRKGCLAGPIHSDNEFQPEPFPQWASVATAIWCCDEFTEENGATHVIPRSHLLCRHPRPGEGEDLGRPILAPAGSIIIWNGATWHSSGVKTTEGERVVLHTSFCRPHIRSLMSFDWVPKEILSAHPPELSDLLGFGGALGFGREGPRAKSMAKAKAQVESMRPWN